MFGVIITFFATTFDEISNSIAKAKLEQKQISLYSMAVINYLLPALSFILVNVFTKEFVFSRASLPTIGIRVVLEIILTYLALRAIEKADRSTFGFIRVLTIPLLLAVDFSLGYAISLYQQIGIVVIIFSLFLVFSGNGISRQGVWLTLATAVLAAATISLFKYDITHYNSVAAEQTIVYLALFIFLIPMAIFKAGENPFGFLRRKIFRLQALLAVIPSFLISYAYSFAPASVILSAYRSSSIFWSVISGKAYFHEKNLTVKIFCLALLVGGIILLTI